ncbi:tripartite tricarboxylate transporter permease [Bacillus sp. Marseille-P3661]|uniref:tripartite tricarboxylate transporter permease n=1 Tax=Bacillus sp. Marseille-P3661 TaxID=1936234 RepID=UPI000C834B43|nr:tripartite tricarboxylate transporter permease [Bacillus sp. Marseille-P3661]
MFGELIQGIQLLGNMQTVTMLLLGSLFGVIIGVIPGLGGIFALAMLLPFVYTMDLVPGITLLLSAHAVINTSGSITSILFGTPGSPGTAATVFDGYPLNKQGKASYALGANLSASCLGGIIGALFLAILIPVIRPVILSFGTPEYFMLTLLGLSLISVIGEDTSKIKAAIIAVLGLLLSTIGMDMSYGVPRFTFDSMYLWDGLPLVPVVIGLFAIAEMADLSIQQASAISEKKQTFSDMWLGFLESFKRWWLVFRCSVIGTLIGIIPGLGSETANFIAYGHAVQTSKNPKLFGKGAIEGVIAPESANNSKEGGSLLPTLALGIPGSAAMALLLGAFMIWGVQPGPDMIENNLPIIYLMVAVLVAGNIIGALISIPMSWWTIKLTNLKASLMVPIIIVLATIGAYVTNNHIGDIIVAFFFGIIGYVMKRYGYSRAIFLIAIVLGGMAEHYLNLSMRIYDFSFIFRPISMLLLVLIILTWTFPLIKGWFTKIRGTGNE